MCDECGERPATIRLTTIAGNEKMERNLCPQCMAKLQNGIPALDVKTLSGLLAGMLSAKKPAEPENEAPVPDLTCEGCALTYREFVKRGRLGCAKCYDSFREPLLAMLERAHGHTQHIGRVPGGADSELSARIRMERLQRELVTAIACEEYEHAARLRDEIRGLKARLEGMGHV